MSSFERKKPEDLSYAELLASTNPPDPKLLYQHTVGSALVTIRSQAVNLVLSRNIVANVRIAADLAVGIARRDPHRRLMYLNAYAGKSLLKQSFKAAVEADAAGACGEQTLPNVRVLHLEIGQWDAWNIREKIREYDSQVLILNSFEFTAMTSALRRRLSQELLELQREFNLTVIVFSHEMKNDVAPKTPARGAIGVLSAYAELVAKLEESDTCELANWRKDAESDNVHEKQMHFTEQNLNCEGENRISEEEWEEPATARIIDTTSYEERHALWDKKAKEYREWAAQSERESIEKHRAQLRAGSPV